MKENTVNKMVIYIRLITMETESKQPILPYVSYPTFKTFIRHLKDTVVTEKIDSSMMPQNFSGSARAAVTTALKSLGLIDDKNNTTNKLKELVTAFDSAAWPTKIKECVLSTYSDITQNIDLESATRKQVEQIFEDASPQMKDKYIRFFLSANKDAGVEYSPHLKIRRRSKKKRIEKLTPKRAASGKQKNIPQGEKPKDEKTPPDMFDQPIPIEPIDRCYIRVPLNINSSQIALVKAAVAFIEAMAQQNEAS